MPIIEHRQDPRNGQWYVVVNGEMLGFGLTEQAAELMASWLRQTWARLFTLLSEPPVAPEDEQ